ncbi:MAG: amidohydrolase family protein [Ketobacteraceae bacterium]|nr:amidohydrolase family protein [Ketobacteraceae bacterium]
MAIPNDFPVIDPHIHQWDLLNTPRILSAPRKLLGWNKFLYEKALQMGASKADRDYVGKVDYVAYDYLPGHYAADVSGLNITHVVHVEASWQGKNPLDAVDETRWVDGLFAGPQNPSDIQLGGIVGFTELRNPDAETVLKAHKEASQKLVGIRQMLAFDKDKGIMRFCDAAGVYRDPVWRENFQLLEKYDLSFDAWFFHHQLDEMVELANAYPDTRFVLCHMGTPIGLAGPFAGYGHRGSDRERVLRIWEHGMARVAECPNVHVKLSGFFMPVVGWGFEHLVQPPSHQQILDKFKPLVDFVIEQFGVSRCMFASNFPMDKASLSLKQLYDLYWDIAGGFSQQEKQALFRDNAAAFYRIGQSA